MNTAHAIAHHIRTLHVGPNFTASDMKSQLSDVNVQKATASIGQHNTIAKLTFHVNYYVRAVLGVLKGGPLDAHDKFSFDAPPIQSEEDWQLLVKKVLADAEELADIVETLPEERFAADFADPKYGSLHRNLIGLIEHTYYHLGQIAILKRLI